MPNRILREGILTSERVNQIACDPGCEVFYRRLHSVVDDFGRHAAHPSLLRAVLYPMCLDTTSDTQITSYLRACEAAGLIQCYVVSGKPYLEVLDFKQQLRTKKPKWPAPDKLTDTADAERAKQQTTVVCIADATQTPSNGETGRLSSAISESNPNPKRIRIESESEENPMAMADVIDRLYQSHPNKAGRVMAEQAFCGKLANSLNPEIVAREIEAAHAAWLPTWQREGGRFAPRLDRWLMEYRYLDAPPDTGDPARAYASEGY